MCNFFLKEEVNKVGFLYYVSYIRFSFYYLLRKQATISLMVNGHYKSRTPLISGRFYFPRRNSG